MFRTLRRALAPTVPYCSSVALTIALALALSITLGCRPGSGSGASNNNSSPTPALVIATQPAGATPGTAFTTQPVVQVHVSGALDTTDNTTVVQAAIVAGTGTSGAVLSGTTSVTVNGGVATFTNLAINLAGSAYRLRFTAAGTTTATSNAFNVGGGGGGIITPSTPPASDYTMTIHSQQDVRAISRYIYGMNGITWGSRPANLTFGRGGGNRWTAYNWENNASNAGSDWFHQNDWLMGLPTDPPAYAATPGITENMTNGAASMITIPIVDHVAADHGHLGGAWPQGDVNQTPNYINVRFKQNEPRKGSAFTTTPDTGDAFVYEDEFVNYILQQFPGATTHATTPVFFSLDNEPDLWSHTHARIRGDASGTNGQKPSYVEMMQRTTDFADAIKDVDANAIVFGPVNYGWQGFVDLQGAPDAGTHGDFHTWYLQQLAAAETTYGRRLVDVLDIHWYPEAQGALAGGGTTRITSDNADPGVAAARMQAPRSLWDTTYTEDSWIATWGTSGPIYLLPRIQAKINANYPGTNIAITEYYYGGGDHISGGVAQADVLGVYGREGVFAANLWRLGSTSHSYIYGGFEMFRDYDGNDGSFGDTSIRAQTTDDADTSVYASVDAADPNRMVIVCINKTGSARTTGIAVSHTVAFNTAEVYTLTTGGGSSPVRQSDIAITLTNAFQYTMPAYSVTTIVLKP